MNKIMKLMALAIVMMIALTGCKAVEVEKPPVDTTTVVAEYKGGTILKGDALERYDLVVRTYEAYGLGEALKDAETVNQLKADVLEYMVSEQIIEDKAKEFGVSEIPEEKRIELVKGASDEYNFYLEMYRSTYATDEMTDEEAREATINGLRSQMGFDEETLQKSELLAYKEQMFFDYVTADVVATDDDIKITYDERVAEDKDTYTADPGAYDQAADAMWAPEGVRTVKHILIQADADLDAELSQLEYELADLEMVIEERQAPAEATDEDEEAAIEDEATEEEATGDELVVEVEPVVGGATQDNTGDEPVFTDSTADAPTDAEQPEKIPANDPVDEAPVAADEDEVPTIEVAVEPVVTTESEGLQVEVVPMNDEEELEEPGVDLETLSLEELIAMRDELQIRVDELRVQLDASIVPIVAEVQAKIDAGEDFDALIETYGKDPGMQNEPTKSKGYNVSEHSTGWDEAFKVGAMELEKVGDVSGPIEGSYGTHFIRYNDDITSGPIDFDFVKESLREETLERMKNELYDAKLAEWNEAAEAKTYPERL